MSIVKIETETELETVNKPELAHNLVDRALRIDEVMTLFDFDKVHKAMAAVGWYYHDNVHETPSVERLQATARNLLKDAWNRKDGQVRSGGFAAWYYPAEGSDPASFGLTFTMASSDIEIRE